MLMLVVLGATQGGPLLLTTGWQAVLEVPQVRAVTVEDTALARATEVRDGQVTLLGLRSGRTRLWAFVGPPEAAQVVEYPVEVTRFPTLLPFERALSLRVDERRVLELAGVTRAELADRTVCRAVMIDQALELTARRAGTTTLLVWVGVEVRYVLVSVRGGAVAPTADELDEELTEPIDERVVLRVGELGVFDMPEGLRWLAIKDETVAGVRPREGGELVFEGLRVGATRVLFWDERGARSARYVVVLPRALGDQAPVPPPVPPEPAPLAPPAAL